MKNIDLGSKKTLAKIKESFNNIINNKIDQIDRDALYKSVDKMSFSKLKHVFETISYKLYDKPNGKKLIREFVNTIRKNEDLKALYVLNDNVFKPNETNNSDIYLNENIDILKNININSDKYKKDIRKCSNAIKSMLDECNMTNEDIVEVFNSYNTKLNMSFDYITENKKTLSNVTEYSNCINVIKEHIENNKKTLSESTKESNVGKLSELYSTDLQEWEKRVIKDISLNTMAGKNKENLFEDYKNECIEILDELIKEDEDNKYTFSGMRESLSAKKYNENTINEDLLKMSELKDTLMSEL